MAENILKNMNLFVEGSSYVGKVNSITPPALTIITEDYRPGGRDVAERIDKGMEPLEASFEMGAYDKELFKLFGWTQGSPVKFEFRGAAESDDGSVVPIKIKMEGRIHNIERDAWTPGEMAPVTFTVSATYYSEIIDGDDVIEIDVKNMVRKIDGVDQLEEQRNALGI